LTSIEAASAWIGVESQSLGSADPSGAIELNVPQLGICEVTLDNEVMLWNSVHRDVHSIPPTYDESGARHKPTLRRSSSCDLFTSAAGCGAHPVASIAVVD
jgi:hypothetical protein